MTSSNNTHDNNDLIYTMDERPKPHIAIFAAFQHLLAIIVPIITPGFLICHAIGLNTRDTSMILSMSLIISGIATYVQCRKFGPFGAGLLIVQGTSFNFVSPMIAGGIVMVKAGIPAEQVMATIFGVVMAGSFIEIAVSRILPFIRRIITPLVTGIIVLIIGLSLIKEGLVSMGGGYSAMSNGSFASPQNLILSLSVFILIIIFNRTNYVWLRSSAIIIALIIGYILAALMGVLNLTPFEQAPYFEVPRPMHFGLAFSWSLFIPMIIIYLVTSLEAVGDITATSKISNEPVNGPKWMERIKGGVLVNGANSLLAGLFNTFPSSVFAQNNGIIQLTGVASRYVGIWIAAILVILGLFPRFSALIQSLPEAALGGATLIMFGSVAASGINILASVKLDRRALLIIAISIALSIGIAQVPQFIEAFPISVNFIISYIFQLFGANNVPHFISAIPNVIASLMHSSLAIGGVTAILLNLFIPERNTQKTA